MAGHFRYLRGGIVFQGSRTCSNHGRNGRYARFSVWLANSLQLFNQGPLHFIVTVLIAAGNQKYQGVGCAKVPGDDGRVAFSIVICVGERIGIPGVAIQSTKNCENQNSCYWLLCPGDPAGQAVTTNIQRFMPGAKQRFFHQNRQWRHQQKYAKHAAYDPLGENHADIKSNSITHEQQGKQPGDGRKGAGSDAHKALCKCLSHGIFGIHAFIPVSVEGVQQHDGIVNRQSQLQYSADSKSNEGNIREDEIGTHVDDDGNCQHNQQNQRFQPGMRGNQQHDQHHSHGNEHHHGNLISHAALHIKLFGRSTAHIILPGFREHASQLPHCFRRVPVL